MGALLPQGTAATHFPGNHEISGYRSSGLEHPGQTQSFSRGYPRRDLGRNKEPVSNHFSDKSANVCKRSAANGSAKKTSPPQNSSFLSCRGGWSRWCIPLECQGEECCCLSLESLQHFNRLLICWPFISVPIFYLIGNFLGPVLKPCSTSLFVGGVFGLFSFYFVLETIVKGCLKLMNVYTESSLFVFVSCLLFQTG